MGFVVVVFPRKILWKILANPFTFLKRFLLLGVYGVSSDSWRFYTTYLIGSSLTRLVSLESILACAKSHSESFWHSSGLQEKLLAFESHFGQKEQGISELLSIANMNMLA
jgi:hypothetical protein